MHAKENRFSQLAQEKPARAEIRTERGAPRLFLNDEEVYPLLGWSWGLLQTTPIFKRCGVNLLHPILGLNAAWSSDGRYDFTVFDTLFAQLLERNPQALFLPRIMLDVPLWWKEKYPDELIRCCLPLKPENDRQYRPVITNPEGGMLWGIQLQEPSWASSIWRRDMTAILRAFLRYYEQSPLAARIFGYQIGSGIYGEWHYFVSEFMPDISSPMQKKLGPLPSCNDRLVTQFGLLRDPEKEKTVIEYYRHFHEEICAETILHFARLVKRETSNRVLCGVFYGYQLENVWIHEGGHLAPEKILRAKEIDFIASPYSYQTTNIEGRQWWEHDVVDGANNYLGRARGIGGDGGYRVLLESVKRHGKLYFPELDAGTFLEPPPRNPDGNGGTAVERELCMVGGAGSTTPEGTRRILRRDLGRMFASGCGGWLFDFGPILRTKKSWYADERILALIHKFTIYGDLRRSLSLASIAQTAAVYDAKSFFVTRHWRAEAPFPFGGYNLDFFSLWFMDSQARSFHRLGAPMDFLYRCDLSADDFSRYRLLFMVNLFYLSSAEVTWLQNRLRNSGIHVIWYFAPGLIQPERVDLEQMQALTGFQFRTHTTPGSLLIRTAIPDADPMVETSFGVNEQRWPRFSIESEDANIYGYWSDNGLPAFAYAERDGWHAWYVGIAPLPVNLLRWLARRAGVMLWSSEPDIVVATEDIAMVVATTEGFREIALHKEMRHLENGDTGDSFQLQCEYGDVHFFIARKDAR